LARPPAHRHRQVQRAAWRHLEPKQRVLRNSGGRVSRSNRPLHSPQRPSPARLASAFGTATGMPKVQPGNPDWVDWVQELVDQAEAASSKAAQTYKKASLSTSKSRTCTRVDPGYMHTRKIGSSFTPELSDHVPAPGTGTPAERRRPENRRSPRQKGQRAVRQSRPPYA
jgi:hypothetical protein